MRRGAALAATLSALTLVVATGVTARRDFTVIDSRAAASQIVHKGGVIRLGPEVYVHEDDKHAAVGITSLTVRDCTIVLGLDYEPGSKVIAAVVDEDETVSELGVQAGVSGGNTEATVFMWRNGQRVCPRWSQFGTVANLWVSITTLDAPEVR